MPDVSLVFGARTRVDMGFGSSEMHDPRSESRCKTTFNARSDPIQVHIRVQTQVPSRSYLDQTHPYNLAFNASFNSANVSAYNSSSSVRNFFAACGLLSFNLSRRHISASINQSISHSVDWRRFEYAYLTRGPIRKIKREKEEESSTHVGVRSSF